MELRPAARTAFLLTGFLCILGGCSPAPHDAAKTPQAAERHSQEPTKTGPRGEAAAESSPASAEPVEAIPGESGTAPGLWRFESGGEVWSTPTVRDGIVFVGSDDRHLYALDAETGERLWAAGPATAAVRSRPAVDGHRVVIVDGDGAVLAFSLGGKALWKHHLGAVDSAIVDGEAYVVVTEDGRLLRLSPDRGELIWQRAIDPPTGAPSAGAGRIMVATEAGDLLAFESSSGRELWRKRIGNGAAGRLAGGTVYAAGGGFVWALRAADGAERWRLWTSEFLSEAPVVAGETLLAAAGDGELWAIETESGLELWRGRLGGPLRAPPTLDSKAAFLGAGDHLFLAYQATVGLELWRFETDATMTRSLAMAPGRLIFGALDGAVYGVAVELPTTSAPGPERRSTAAVTATPSFHDRPPTLVRTHELGARGLAVAADHGRLYALVEGELIAIENGDATRDPMWRSAAHSSPMLLDDTSLVIATDDSVRRLGPDGQEIWRTTTQAVATSPGGLSPILVGDDAGRLWAFAASDGHRIWRQQMDGIVRGSAILSPNLVLAAHCPSVRRTASGSLLALDPKDGRELWRFDATDCLASSPLPIDDVVYAISASGEALALDAAVGGLRWQTPLGGGSRFAPKSHFGMLYVSTDDGLLHALDLGSGVETWRSRIGPRPSTGTEILDGIAHVGSHDDRIYAINALNGDLLWQLEIGSTPMGLVTEISRGRRWLHAITFDGRLLTFDLR